jgi:hypothetical protein
VTTTSKPSARASAAVALPTANSGRRRASPSAGLALSARRALRLVAISAWAPSTWIASPPSKETRISGSTTASWPASSSTAASFSASGSGLVTSSRIGRAAYHDLRRVAPAIEAVTRAGAIAAANAGPFVGQAAWPPSKKRLAPRVAAPGIFSPEIRPHRLATEPTDFAMLLPNIAP